MQKKPDLIFIGENYQEYELPKEKRYLLKYFKTDVQIMFLKYYYTFGNYENFMNHTGLSCQERWLEFLEKRLQYIEQAKNEARKNMDLELISKIEAGKLKIKLKKP